MFRRPCDLRKLRNLAARGKNRNAKVRLVARPQRIESRRRNSHHRERNRIEMDHLADNGTIARETPHPETVGEHRFGLPEALPDVGGKGLAERRRYSEHLEKLG